MHGDEDQATGQHQPGAHLPGSRAPAGGRCRGRRHRPITGIEQVGIGVTLCDLDNAVGLPPIAVDEPTLTMNFRSILPAAGGQGRQVRHQPPDPRPPAQGTADQRRLRVRDTAERDVFERFRPRRLHLTILLETCAAKATSWPCPVRAVQRYRWRPLRNPTSMLTVDVEEHQGGVMEELGRRKGEMMDMVPDGRAACDRIPHSARGLIGFQGEFMT